LDVPKDPWDPSDTTSLPGYPYPAEDNKMQPWVTVLDTLTKAAWCGGNTTVEQVAAAVTTNLYEGGKFRYEPNGSINYQIYTSSLSYFNLTSFHNQIIGSGSPTTVGCADMAWGVKVFSNLLGDELKVMHIGLPSAPVYLRDPITGNYILDSGGNLIQTGYASNPFTTNQILAIGMTAQEVKSWNYHAVAWRGGNDDSGTVYDACIKLQNGSGWELPVNMAFTSYRSKLTPTLIGRQGLNDSIHRLD
jgi:hypothetical protein